MSVKLKPLSEQVIVITGASSGIGRTTARRAAERGATVLLVARDEDGSREVVGEIEAAGGTAAYAVADVGDQAQVDAAARVAIDRFGRVDTWVNDAGTSVWGKLLDIPNDEHERMMRTNYFGAVHGCRAAVPLLRDAGGALITVGSIASDLPTPIMGAYSATKHALKAYVEVLRMELRDMGAPISVTLIKPSGIDTPIAQHTRNHQPGEAQIPPVIYAPELVADAILTAAEKPRREITVGGSGRLQVLLGLHFPWIYERVAPKAAAKLLTDPDKKQPPTNLWEGRGGSERSGEHAAKTFSLYTKAVERPAATLAVAAAGAAALGAWWFRRREQAA
ncbi:SDR family oxidoreductase [Sphingomonas lenta]|uniref:Short-chain dehydrogenase n=1 Tax=Sphingomonas lenta TaxID=1141887 RepID=A0A2A2SG57_9SPHN|nr:SDR family oxidoreductase [Sphingomonas lenta]PAX08195.1 short-chain dehydrogenase [Sphingomonas lenta]